MPTSELNVFPRAMSLAVHELRTPVTVVAGYLRMLLREHGGPLTDVQRKMIEEADRSCSRINSIIAEMSELGKLEARELSLPTARFDLAAAITEMASNMHDGEDRGVRLEVRGASQPIMVMGDRTRLTAAIGALMRAAVRERGQPGTIIVECSVSVDQGRQWAIVAIGDEPVAHALATTDRHASAPFDEWRGGLGLALPVGRRVIEAHGGAIWPAAGDAPRAGAAVRLPVAQEDAGNNRVP